MKSLKHHIWKVEEIEETKFLDIEADTTDIENKTKNVQKSAGTMETKEKKSIWRVNGNSAGQNGTNRMNRMSNTMDVMTGPQWSLCEWLN